MEVRSSRGRDREESRLKWLNRPDPRDREYGFGGGLKCYKCKKYGHFGGDCEAGPNAGTKTCYKCGGIGHILKECPSRD